MTHWRRIVRERVLQALYAYQLSQEPVVYIIESVLGNLKNHKSEFDFAKRLLTSVIQHRDELDAFITAKAANWESNRIAIVDMQLLRMGICEFLYFPDIPPKVTINEAIEIAKIFSTEKSGQFINGILDAVLAELRSGGLLVKTGRGLVDQTPKASNRKK